MYYRHSPQSNGWNIFARELQNVLRKYNLSLEQLESRVGIDPEKVRRLSQSSHSSKSLPILSPDEMDRLTRALNLSEDDITRLDAAILASTIQQTLAERISKNDTQHAINQLFPLILRAFNEEAESTLDFGNTRGGPDPILDDDSELDNIFVSTLTAIDNANRILLLSTNMSSVKRKAQLQLAITFFTEALKELDKMPSNHRKTTRWQYWRQDAQQGLVSAQELLAKL
ncbi:MAG: hypothetical protein NVS2B12_27270 [Ktedonobacteraceae bacterium]